MTDVSITPVTCRFSVFSRSSNKRLHPITQLWVATNVRESITQLWVTVNAFHPRLRATRILSNSHQATSPANYVVLDSGENLNATLIREGCATAIRTFPYHGQREGLSLS